MMTYLNHDPDIPRLVVLLHILIADQLLPGRLSDALAAFYAFVFQLEMPDEKGRLRVSAYHFGSPWKSTS
jgi:hypothetical protein